MSRKLVLLMLVIVVASAVLGAIARVTTVPAGASPASPPPAPAPSSTANMLGAVAAFQRAFNAGDVTRLCRPDALVDGAVIHALDAQPGGCVAEAESLVNAAAPLRLVVLGTHGRPGLMTARVANDGGPPVTVNLLPHHGRWLLSFSGTADPLSALGAP